MEYTKKSLDLKKGIIYTQISRLLLDKSSSEPRNEIHNVLFEIGIFSNMKLKEWLTFEEIKNSLSYEIGVKSYPSQPLKRAISRLQKENRIKIKEEHDIKYYSLDKERIEQFKQYIKEMNEVYNRIINNLVEEIKKDYETLSRKNIDTISEVFDLTLSSIFTTMENVSSTILITKSSKSEKIILDFPSRFRKHLRKIGNPKLRQVVSNKIIDSFQNPSKDMKKYSLMCANSSFILKLLNLDPDCQRLERNLFSNIVLYLDTNILISALYPAHELHDLTHEVLKESMKLGVNLYVTERTLKELDNSLSRANEMFSKSSSPTKSKYYIPENIIIETYVRFSESKGDNWETFLSANKQIQSILEKRYKITFDVTNYHDVIDNKKLYEFSQIVKKCSEKRLFPKSDEVAEHDAYHFLIVDYLRNGNSPNNIWFLSHDRTFGCVNNGYFQLENKSLPCSLLGSSWMEILFPFISPEISEEHFEDMFLKIMASDFFPITRTLSFGKLTRFFAPFFNDDELDEEDYIAILQDQFLNKLVDEWKKSSYSSECDDKLMKKVSELVDKRKDEKIHKLRGEIARRDKIIQEKVKTEKEAQTQISELELDLKSEKIIRDSSKKFGEIFIVTLVSILAVLMLIILHSDNLLNIWTIFVVISVFSTIGGTLIGIYRWLIKEKR
jgi:predicted nucleic acid-binding protein